MQGDVVLTAPKLSHMRGKEDLITACPGPDWLRTRGPGRTTVAILDVRTTPPQSSSVVSLRQRVSAGPRELTITAAAIGDRRGEAAIGEHMHQGQGRLHGDPQACVTGGDRGYPQGGRGGTLSLVRER